jgi:hypothetical protein
MSLSMAGCSWEHETVAITLEEARIEAVPLSEIFRSSPMDAAAASSRRHVLRMLISSDTDLEDYFKDWQLQVRCRVEGAGNGRHYQSSGWGPYVERPQAAAPGKHVYSIYSFVDLDADDVEYDKGKPVSTLELDSQRFDRMGCHLIGVQMQLFGRWARSNDVWLSDADFRTLLARSQPVGD